MLDLLCVVLDTVLVLGHSFVRRLQQHVQQKTSREPRIGNFRVLFQSKGGADVSAIRHLADGEQYRRVFAVHIEAGSNDLAARRVDVDEVAAAIMRLSRWLLRQGVRKVVVGEIIYRTKNARPMPVTIKVYNDRVNSVNGLLQRACVEQDNVEFRSHRRLRAEICQDGVHLTKAGQSSLWRDVSKLAA